MATGIAARNGGRVGLLTLAAILLLGLGLRLGEAWDGRAPVYDAAAYAAIARNLDEGRGYTVGAAATQPSDNYSPGLPLLATGIYELSGGVHERLARLVLALIGTLAALFAYLIGRRLSGPPAGLIAAAAVAVYPALLEYQGMLMGEPLAASLLAGAVLAMLWARDPGGGSAASGHHTKGAPRTGGRVRSRPGAPSHPLGRWLLPGVVLGALVMVRPEYLGVGVLLGLVVFVGEARNDWRGGLTRAALLLVGMALVVAPWTARNAFALHRFVSVSTGGGQVLYSGTYLPSEGNPEKVGAGVVAEHPELFGPHAVENLRLEQILARYGEHIYPELEPDKALSKLGKAQLEDDVIHHTGEYVGFLAKKVGRIWSHGPRAVMREPVWEALHWVLLGLGLLGLGLLAYYRRWEALMIGAVFLAITAISALLVASPRRVLVLIPLLSACAGAAIAWIAAPRRAKGQSVL
jgi:4-amino-4-deoxy-L-arabinose transferase-like glycosyltransferase